MKSMVLKNTCSLHECKTPLSLMEMPDPVPKSDEILIRVNTCGVCHTELDEIEGRTMPPKFPVIPGHQVVGRVEKLAGNSSKFKIGDRVGVAWIFSACGKCKFCLKGNENLCPEFKATGRDVNGGYAEYMTVPEKFAYLIPDTFSDSQAAPLLCAGSIGYRSLKLSELQNGQKIGLTGFGASAHIVLKIVSQTWPQSDTYVFARKNRERDFAIDLGAVWAGDIEETAPVKLDCIIDTTPAWKPVVEALNNLEKGGRLVINAIRKQSRDKQYLLNLDYPAHLWMEKEIKSVANITSQDISDFLSLAAKIDLQPEVQEYPLEDANKALMELKSGQIHGAKVLTIH